MHFTISYLCLDYLQFTLSLRIIYYQFCYLETSISKGTVDQRANVKVGPGKHTNSRNNKKAGEIKQKAQISWFPNLERFLE